MANYNTGGASATSVTIDKKAGGASLSGYPKTYSLLPAFPGYAAITAATWSMYTAVQRSTRRAAFISYINGLESIIAANIQTNQPTKTDVATCPVGQI
jgi:hypothetical protein